MNTPENNPTQAIATQPDPSIKQIKWKGNKKQKLFMAYYTDPQSKTFANAYQSGLKAGFSPSYSKNITHLAPSWLSEYMENMDLRPEHIKLGISRIATGEIDSRSVDDTRLKAYELLMKLEGLDKNKNTTNINIVQPILSAVVANPDPPKAGTLIDLDN